MKFKMPYTYSFYLFITEYYLLVDVLFKNIIIIILILKR